MYINKTTTHRFQFFTQTIFSIIYGLNNSAEGVLNILHHILHGLEHLINDFSCFDLRVDFRDLDYNMVSPRKCLI